MPKRKRVDAKPHACDFEGCGIRFAAPSLLQTHKRTHTGERPFACDWEGCDARFAQSGALQKHKRTHTGERPFACDFEGCDARFARVCGLQKHNRALHTGERPFACDFKGCDARFTQSGALLAHKRTHTGEKPYACDWEDCGKRFAQVGALQKHKRTHTGERPFACDFEGCGARFTQSSDLPRHNRALHTARGQLRQRKREEQVARALVKAGLTFDREVSVQFCGQANKASARVDFVIYRSWGTVLLEVDESQHAHYGVSCEAARMLNVFAEQMKQGRAGKFHFVRFNPDAYAEGGAPQKTLLKDRLAALLRTLEQEPAKQYSVTYLYYTRSDSPLPDACLDPEYPGSLRAIVNC